MESRMAIKQARWVNMCEVVSNGEQEGEGDLASISVSNAQEEQDQATGYMDKHLN